jgi:hypothetical protein
MSAVKRQHYVWRAYLRPWAENESIWTHFIQLNKIERTSLMGVAQEKYFYKLVDFTAAEEAFLEEYIDRSSPAVLKSLNLDFLTIFTSTGKLKKQLDETINPVIEKEKYAEEIRKLEINLMEIAHGKMENLGQQLIAYRSLEDLKTIEENDYLFEAIMFLCFQYFRTRSMRNAVLQTFISTPFEALAKKSWNILSYVTATTLARSISLDPRLKFIFHENNTTDHFITSDQPVFNILNDQVNENGEVTELELYYPISPKHALTLHFRNDQQEKYISNDADTTLIDYLNKKVIENADFYLFADSKAQLELLK